MELLYHMFGHILKESSLKHRPELFFGLMVPPILRFLKWPFTIELDCLVLLHWDRMGIHLLFFLGLGI